MTTFKRISMIALICATSAVSACSDEAASNAELQAEEPLGPQASYDQQDGDLYMYIGEASEEAAARGVSNPIAAYRYLGEEDGEYRLEMVADDGSRLLEIACSAPCRVAKQTDAFGSVTRFAVEPRSLNAAAFRDAANGFLLVSNAPSKPLVQQAVPIAAPPSLPSNASASDDWRGSKGTCRLNVNGTPYITGACWIRMEGDGSFQIMSLDEQYFAKLLRSEGVAMGHWNETPNSSHAHSGLGEMTRAGGCWQNANAEICAWSAP